MHFPILLVCDVACSDWVPQSEAVVANVKSRHSPGWFMVRMVLFESMVVTSWHINLSKTVKHRDVVDACLIRRFEEQTVAVEESHEPDFWGSTSS